MTIIKTELFKNKNHCKDLILRKILEKLLNKKGKNLRSLFFRIRIQMKLIRENLEKKNHRRNIRKITAKMKARIIILINKDRHHLLILSQINPTNSRIKIINLTISNRYNKTLFQAILLLKRNRQ